MIIAQISASDHISMLAIVLPLFVFACIIFSIPFVYAYRTDTKRLAAKGRIDKVLSRGTDLASTTLAVAIPLDMAKQLAYAALLINSDDVQVSEQMVYCWVGPSAYWGISAAMHSPPPALVIIYWRLLPDNVIEYWIRAKSRYPLIFSGITLRHQIDSLGSLVQQISDRISLAVDKLQEQ